MNSSSKSPAVAPSGRRLDSEPDYLEGLERNCKNLKGELARGYISRSADWVREKYPGSAATLLPKLRELYKRYQ